MVAILMIPAKMATPGLLKIKVFWRKGYDVIISVHDVTNKILARDSNHNDERSYHNLNFIKIWPEKQLFLRGGLGSSSIVWDWH